MNGVLLINKEKAYTSFDVVAVVRGLTGQKKAGHTGTLDPNATGVLPVLLGTATKAQDVIPCHDKQYVASFRFGVATDTLDIWGAVTEEKPSSLTAKAIEDALGAFCGEIEQLPPMYSAVSVNGKRLYQYAREGKQVERRARRVTVYSLSLLSFDEDAQSGTLAVSCSGGTYIRTLIDDLARSLGTLGVMTDLVRTEACGYRLEDCITLGELKALREKGEFPPAALTENGDLPDGGQTCYFRNVESLFADYPQLVVTDKQAHRFRNGNPLDIARTALKHRAEGKKIFRVKAQDGTFLSLGIVDGESLKMYKHF